MVHLDFWGLMSTIGVGLVVTVVMPFHLLFRAPLRMWDIWVNTIARIMAFAVYGDDLLSAKR